MATLIRQMTLSDVPELASGYVQAFGSADEPWTDATAHALLANWLHRQPDLAFTAEADGKLVGALMIGIRPWCDGNHLVDGELFVIPECQKNGIASDLLREALAVAVAKYNPVVWETYTFRAQKFPFEWYQKLGFREIEEWMMIRADVSHLLSRTTGVMPVP
jgi:ribosomal protein S18 acetylase RimI-like enzyme